MGINISMNMVKWAKGLSDKTGATLISPRAAKLAPIR